MPATLAEERRKAILRPITGPYPSLAQEIRRLLGYEDDGREFLTAHMAAHQTGASHSSISRIARGEHVEEGPLMRLAKGLNGDSGKLLSLAGYRARRYPGSLPETLSIDGDDAAAVELMDIYNDMSPEQRVLLVAFARTIATAGAHGEAGV